MFKEVIEKSNLQWLQQIQPDPLHLAYARCYVFSVVYNGQVALQSQANFWINKDYILLNLVLMVIIFYCILVIPLI